MKSLIRYIRLALPHIDDPGPLLGIILTFRWTPPAVGGYLNMKYDFGFQNIYQNL